MDEQPFDCATASDSQLLRAYADGGSQAAFAALVARHVDLVYGAARRQLRGDFAHLVEDVTQAVFILLAAKARARAIGERVVLAGWLHHATRHAAANARKIESRRRRHERQGGAMSRSTTDDDDRSGEPWAGVAPLLDGALARLPRGDRDVVLLKFMQEKSHRAVGEALGISEEAARKRVGRAVDRLRAVLVRRANGTGVVVPAAGVLAALLTAEAAHAAPPALGAACALSGSSAVATASTSGAATAVAKATGSTLTWLQAKAVAACLAVAGALVGGIGYTAHRLYAQAPAGPTPARQPVATPVVPVAAAAQAKPVADEEVVRAVVVDVDGRPLAGVEVYAATPQRPVALYDPTRQGARAVVTGADGTFSLPRPAGKDWMIVALSEGGGVARVKPADLVRPADGGDARVVLQPWGRIEGRLLAGDRPLRGEGIYMGAWSDTEDPLSRCVVNNASARTDRDGRFTIARVAPGTIVLSHRDDRQESKFSKWETVDVAPGKVASVDVGAAGRPVVGQLAVPAGWEKKITFALDAVHWADITARRSDLTPMPVPPGYDKLPPAEQRRIRSRWHQSAEGAEYRRNMYPEQYFPRTDGSFRLDALRPGRYRVEARLYERDAVSSTLEDVASAYFEVTVPPPSPPGTKFAADPVDLGRIVLKPVTRIVVGQPAPAFQAFTVDGDPVRLADFKGRLLAVQFRWPKVANADTAGVGKAQAAFANDPRVAFLTVHLNAKPEDVRGLIADEALEWPQAVASRAGPFPLPEGYMRGPAMIHLIGSDGVVRRKVLRGSDLEAAIAQVLLEQEK